MFVGEEREETGNLVAIAVFCLEWLFRLLQTLTPSVLDESLRKIPSPSIAVESIKSRSLYISCPSLGSLDWADY